MLAQSTATVCHYCALQPSAAHVVKTVADVLTLILHAILTNAAVRLQEVAMPAKSVCTQKSIF